MPSKIKSEIILVTPEMAKQYLLCNEGNRLVRPGWVNYLTYCIQSNEWQTTHQGVAFANDGRLLDGQHRLMAIVKAGIPTELMVSYGWDEAVFAAIDNGMHRSDSDRTGIPKRVVECAKFFIYIMAYEGTENTARPGEKNLGATRLTPEQIKRYATVISDFHAALTSTSSTLFSSVPSRCAVIAVMMMGYDIKYAIKLYRDLVLGNTVDLPPIGSSAMRQYVTGTLNSKGGGEVRFDNFAKLIPLYKKENKDVQKLMLRDRNERIAEVRNVLRHWFNGQDKTPREIATQGAVLNDVNAQVAA